MNDLRVSLVQGNTRWHDPEANLSYYGELISSLRNKTDVIILPETFTSGFSNESINQAESMEGKAVQWMRQQTQQLNAAVCGSVQLRAKKSNGEEGVFNRMLFITPDQQIHTYDKRHLFRYANEHQRYAAGKERITVEWKGWRICPLVCYDLRFPVFSRNRYNVEQSDGLDYDLLIYVANWPQARAYAWKSLLRARAIENLCYVAAVNRVGTDGNNLSYAGDSVVLDFLGQPMSECGSEETVATRTLDRQLLLQHRQNFPAMLDADQFSMQD